MNDLILYVVGVIFFWGLFNAIRLIWKWMFPKKFYVNSKIGHDLPGSGMVEKQPCATLGYALSHCPENYTIQVSNGHTEYLTSDITKQALLHLDEYIKNPSPKKVYGIGNSCGKTKL